MMLRTITPTTSARGHTQPSVVGGRLGLGELGDLHAREKVIDEQQGPEALTVQFEVHVGSLTGVLALQYSYRRNTSRGYFD